MKMGWRVGGEGSKGLLLAHSPASAFIEELSKVDELGVLVTYDPWQPDTSVVLFVRHLDYALQEVDWRCGS